MPRAGSEHQAVLNYIRRGLRPLRAPRSLPRPRGASLTALPISGDRGGDCRFEVDPDRDCGDPAAPGCAGSRHRTAAGEEVVNDLAVFLIAD